MAWFGWPAITGNDPPALDLAAGSPAYFDTAGESTALVYPLHSSPDPVAIFTARPGSVAGVRPGMLSWGGLPLAAGYGYPSGSFAMSVYDSANNLIGSGEFLLAIYQEWDVAAVELDFAPGYDIGRIEVSLYVSPAYHNTTTWNGNTYSDVFLDMAYYYMPVVADVEHNIDGLDPRAPFWTGFLKTKEVAL
jgi:hypothetical protein